VRVGDNDPEVVVAPDGTTTTVVWRDPEATSAITVVVAEHDLAHAVAEIGRSCHTLWPSATVDEAGFNLLFVHLQEVIATATRAVPF